MIILNNQEEYSRISHIFRAYDIRGIYNQEITPKNHFRIGLAFGTFLRNQEFKTKSDKVFIAYDIRKTSSMLAQAFAAGVMTTGIDIELSGESLQFGACMFTAWQRKSYATAYITASHLPAEWNGVKFYYGSGVGFSEEDNMTIRDIFIEGNFIRSVWNKVGQMSILNLKEEYISFLKKKFCIKRPMTVVVDCGNGSSCLSAPKALESIGLDVRTLFCNVDPTFPNRSSEPNEESLQFLSEKVIKEGADFGVGFDGDGDRAVIVDDKGRVLLADMTGLILAKYMIKDHPDLNRVLVNVECSHTIEKELPESVIVERIKVGHTFLTAEAQKKRDTLIGIESSGHMVFPSVFLFDDAMLIPLKLAEILSNQNNPLSKLVDEIPSLNKRKIAIETPDAIKFEVITQLLNRLSKQYSKLTSIDGIGISIGEDSWVLIRASNTSPKIRITVEAESKSKAEDLLLKFKEELERETQKLV